MTKDEALRLALEWLESHKPKISDGSLPVLTHAQVRDAVKAALEKKAENAEELGLNYYVPCCTDKTCSKCKAALEAKDEPVACKECHLKDTVYDLLGELKVANLKLSVRPQRTWVGLTDEERYELLSKADWAHDPESYAVLVEAKLKDKNNA